MIDIGNKYGKLTVISKGKKFYQPSGQFQQGWTCKCECGRIKDIRGAHLESGRTTSCNCNGHGETGTKLHNTWRGMKNRCKPYHSESHLYYDKGIKVCKEWNTFNKFKEWALQNGYKDGLTIDRIDGNKGYYPDNCRFVSQKVNSNNTENTFYVNYNGDKKAFMLLLDEKGLTNHSAAIRSRIKRGWPVSDAINKPIRQGNYGKQSV